LGNNDNAKTTAIQIDKAGEDGETKVELYGKMTAIQIDKAGEGGEMKVKVNGKDVPYETLKTIPSEEIGEMKIVKLDGVGTIYVTTKDELEAQTKEFAQKMKDFEQAEKQFAKADKDFKQAEKQFAQAEKAFKQMEKDVQQQNPPYIKAEKMPKFRNGDLMLFQNWMQSNVQYPAEAIEKGISGRVVFSFVVEADGSLSSYQLMASPDKILADEVERVFNSSPREWTAGEQKGQKVRVKYTLPIVFTAVADSGASKDFASLYAAGMDYIAKGDKLEKEVGAKEYKNQSDYKADMNSVNNYYKSAMSALESAYALNPQHKPTVQSLYMIAFRLRDESGMMAKYEKYKSALQSL
jgi:TonB family protein